MIALRLILLMTIISGLSIDIDASDAIYLQTEIKGCKPSLLSSEAIKKLNIRLFDAIENKDLNAVREALQAGAQANAIKIAADEPHLPSAARSALHAAVSLGHLGLIKLLLDSGAIITFEVEQLTAFAYLAYQEHLHNLTIRSIVELFITYTPPPAFPTLPKLGQQHINDAFHHAAMARNVVMTETILEYAEISQRHIDETFHHAVMAKNAEMAEFILEYAEISEDIENKLNYEPTIRQSLVDSFLGTLTFSGQKAMEEQHHYAWMAIELAQRHANHSTKENEQNTAD